jgi:pimeloyl-ACP methyl ester carboxylesterase
MMTKLLTIAVLLLASALASAQVPTPTRIVVGEVELHYVEHGAGEPLILLHGGQGDLRAWGPHTAVLSKHYRVISYSRRYHWPNRNPLRPGYSALVDAEDLGNLIRALDLGRVHLVGRSAGAFAALALAVQHPELVRSLVLAEPPVLAWLASSPQGAPLYRDFMARTHEKAAPLFAAGDDVGALTTFIDAFDGPGTFASMAAARRTSILQNVGYFKAITASADPYPDLPRAAVAKLDVSALVVRGEHAYPRDVLVTDELARTLPRARLLVIPGAGHGSPQDKPVEFTQAVMEFLQASPMR